MVRGVGFPVLDPFSESVFAQGFIPFDLFLKWWDGTYIHKLNNHFLLSVAAHVSFRAAFGFKVKNS